MRTKILGAILFVMPAAVVLTTQASGNETTPQCSSKPGASTPAGRHWYYRINHANNQHCWYLAAEGLPVRTHRPRLLATTSPESAPPAAVQQRAVAAEPAAALAPLHGRSAGAPPAAATAAQIAFTERWAELPHVKNFDALDLNPSSNSYASPDAPKNATEQMPARWPVIDGTRVQDDPSKGSKAGGLQSLSFIGPLGIALLVLAGATLDLALAPRRSAFRRVWRAILTPRQPRVASRRVTARAAAAADSRPNRRPPTLTDPAIDLKASLTELMGVLQQAGIGCDAPRSFAPVAAAMYRDQAYRRPPRRMEALQRYSSSGRSGVASRHV